jgi:hypothetical protein
MSVRSASYPLSPTAAVHELSSTARLIEAAAVRDARGTRVVRAVGAPETRDGVYETARTRGTGMTKNRTDVAHRSPGGD